MGHDILIVDDDPEMLRMLSVFLDGEGYAVRQAASTDEAIRLASDHRPDLVLMDLVQPVENGLLSAERLKSTSCSDVPIIAISTADPTIARQRAMACFEAWLPKPFSLDTLLHFVALAEDVAAEQEAERRGAGALGSGVTAAPRPH